MTQQFIQVPFRH